MDEKNYMSDFKNLKPRPLERIPMEKFRRDIINQSSKINKQYPVINHQSKKEVNYMEPLNNSKTLWGFGIAVFIFILQQVLVVFNIAGPNNMLVNAGIEVIIAVAGFFGVYGIRDALRKMGKG